MNCTVCAVALLALTTAATTFGCSDDTSTDDVGSSSSNSSGSGGTGAQGGQGGTAGQGGRGGQGGIGGVGGIGGIGGTGGQGGPIGDPVCGDLTCNGAETCTDCPDDCGHCPAVCGDGACEVPETCTDCPDDCDICPPVCGDDVCEPERENCQACSADCGACPPSTDCSHPVCEEGAPLLGDCDPCVTAVCASDPQCCMSAWDSQCVTDLTTECGVACGCSHDLCTAGDGLDPACHPCVASVCAEDSYCCTMGWDDVCAGYAAFLCGVNCP